MQLHILSEVSPVIVIHAGAALAALATGLSLIILPRGRLAHRILGSLTAFLLVVTAISAMFILQLNNGWPSFLHVFVPLTFLGLFGLSMGLARRNWKQHRNAGRRLIFGALLIPGLIAFAPGRLLHIVVFG